MGFASGSDIANDVIYAIKDKVPAKHRHPVYVALYDALRGHDWDTVDESLGIDFCFDEVVYERDPIYRPDAGSDCDCEEDGCDCGSA